MGLTARGLERDARSVGRVYGPYTGAGAGAAAGASPGHHQHPQPAPSLTHQSPGTDQYGGVAGYEGGPLSIDEQWRRLQPGSTGQMQLRSDGQVHPGSDGQQLSGSSGQGLTIGIGQPGRQLLVRWDDSVSPWGPDGLQQPDALLQGPASLQAFGVRDGEVAGCRAPVEVGPAVADTMAPLCSGSISSTGSSFSNSTTSPAASGVNSSIARSGSSWSAGGCGTNRSGSNASAMERSGSSLTSGACGSIEREGIRCTSGSGGMTATTLPVHDVLVEGCSHQQQQQHDVAVGRPPTSPTSAAATPCYGGGRSPTSAAATP